jgi:hypothetical protein
LNKSPHKEEIKQTNKIKNHKEPGLKDPIVQLAVVVAAEQRTSLARRSFLSYLLAVSLR